MLDRALRHFGKIYSAWSFHIPVDHATSRSSGRIQEKGWLIQYCFGRDESGEFLGYYATHRMTGDSHRRIHEDGRVIRLSCLRYFDVASDDPVEAKHREDELHERNRKVADELVSKGFNLFTLNMLISLGQENISNP